jgi:hypothetical protein
MSANPEDSINSSPPKAKLLRVWMTQICINGLGL